MKSASLFLIFAVVAALSIGFGSYEYSRVVELQQKQSQISSDYQTLSEKLALASQNNTLLSKQVSNLTSGYQVLSANYSKLQVQLYATENQLETSISEMENANATYIKLLSSADQQQSQFYNQIAQIHFSRTFLFYNYKTNQTSVFHWDIPFKTYAIERGNLTLHTIPYQGDPKEGAYYQLALSRYPDLALLASFIRGISGNDDELYSNLALQASYQMDYVVTDYTKMPIETMVENSGDCKSHAIFVTSLLRAGGINATLLIGRAIGSLEDQRGVGHAIVGIPLSTPPNDIPNQSWHYVIGGKTYYVAETTWPNGFAPNHGLYYPPADYRHSVVGDLTWIDFKLLTNYFVS